MDPMRCAQFSMREGSTPDAPDLDHLIHQRCGQSRSDPLCAPSVSITFLRAPESLNRCAIVPSAFDIGMHNGDDTAFHLHQGYNFVELTRLRAGSLCDVPVRGCRPPKWPGSMENCATHSFEKRGHLMPCGTIATLKDNG